MISALKWIRKGVAKEVPDRFALTEAEYEAIAGKIGVSLSKAKSMDPSPSSSPSAAKSKDMTKQELQQGQKTKKDLEEALTGLEEYRLEDYDDDETPFGSDDEEIPQETGNFIGLFCECIEWIQTGAPQMESHMEIRVHSVNPLSAFKTLSAYDTYTSKTAALFSNIKGLTYYASNEQDPYLQLGKKEAAQDDDEEEEDEIRILPTDNLLLAAKTEDDMSHIEVYVYEEEEENLYVHHDIMLPSFPLCMEWLDFAPGQESATTAPGAKGNFVAIGTFDPQIEIWNLDCLDVMFPAAILGVSAEEALATLPKGKKKKRLAGARVHPDFHTDAVVALSWNPLARSLLASGSADTSIKLWDLNQPAKALRSFIKHDDKVAGLQWNPVSQSVLLSGGFDSKAVVFDTRSPDENSASFQLDADVECLSWDPFSPERFMVSTESGIVHCYDARSPSAPLFKLHAHDGPVSALDISSAVKGLMVTGSSDKTVKIWNINGNAPSCIASRDLGTGSVFSTNFARDAPFHLAVGGSKGKLVLWNLENNAGVRKAFSLPSHSKAEEEKKKKPTKEVVGMDDEEEEEEDEEEEDAFEDIPEDDEDMDSNEDEDMETDEEDV